MSQHSAAAMATRVALLLLVASRSLLVSARVVPQLRLPFEAHSHNDLDAWPQLLLKGVRWIKLDLSLCSEASCVAHSTFSHVPGRGNASDCFAVGADTLCCICMRGDASFRPTLDSTFNTSADLVGFIRSSPLVPTAAGDDAPLMLGMDWGGPTPPQGVMTPLVSRFLLALNATIFSAGRAVVPYLDDEMNGWLSALDRKCSASSCSAAEEAVDSLSWPAESGAPLPDPSTDPRGRFRLINAAQGDLAPCCASDCWAGSAQRAAGYPFLFWEQYAQTDYQTVLREWANCSTVPPDKRSVNTGMVAVSNGGVEQMEVYSAFSSATLPNVLGRGVNALFGLDVHGRHVQPIMLVLEAGLGLGGAFDHVVIVVTTSRVTGSATVVSAAVCGYLDGLAPDAADCAQPLRLPLPANWTALSPSARVVSAVAWEATAQDPGVVGGTTPFSAGAAVTPIVVATSDGWAVLLQYDAGTGVLSAAGVPLVALPSPAELAHHLRPPAPAPSPTRSAGTNAILALSLVCPPVNGSGATAPPDPWGGCVALYASQSAGASATAVQVLALPSAAFNASTLLATQFLSFTPVVDAGAAMVMLLLSVEQSAASSIPSSSLTYASAGVMLLSSTRVDTAARPQLFSVTIDVSVTLTTTPHLVPSSSVLTLNQTVVNGSVPVRLGFGSQPHLTGRQWAVSVSAVGSGGGGGGGGVVPMVLHLHTSSTCQCGQLINNDGTPHCELPLHVSDSNLILSAYQSVDNLLSYDYGTLAAFRAASGRVAADEAASAFSVCHPSIMSGVFESGVEASGALMVHNVGGTPARTELALLVLHDGNVTLPLVTLLICGPPIAKAGLVWDSFHLVQPEELVGLGLSRA